MKPDTVSDITDWIRKDRIDMGRSNAPCIEALGALRAVCQIFLRIRARACIERSGGQWAQLVRNLSERARQTQAVEQLQLEDRAPLVAAGLTIIRDWPESFVDFANETGISRAHFNGAECLQPPWMTEVVNSKLARQNRSVTDAVLEATTTTLTRQLQRNPTKTELRKHLAWQGEKGLEKIFAKRTQATSSEWHQFLAAIADTERRVASRARSRNAFACETAVLMMCLMTDTQINSFQGFQRLCLCRVLTSRREQLNDSTSGLLPLIVNIEGMLDLLPTAAGRFSSISARQVTKLLNFLMLSLPRELCRDVRVFAGPAGTHSQQ